MSCYLSRVVRKPAFCICENKDADQLRGNAKLISAFVFATWIVQSFFYLNSKFQASSHLLWLYSLVCVGPGRKTRRQVFSEQGSFHYQTLVLTLLSHHYPYSLDRYRPPSSTSCPQGVSPSRRWATGCPSACHCSGTW